MKAHRGATARRVAAIQIRARGTPEENLAQAEVHIGAAAAAGANLVVLPEHFVYYNVKDLVAAAETEISPSGPARSFFARQARKYNIWLAAGTLPLFAANTKAQPRAAALMYAPSGEEVARYDKIHLFDVVVAATGKRYCESDRYNPGSEAVTVDSTCGRIGMSVCYDLRFPELYRILANQGAELLIAPSAFTANTGAAHWRLLLQARAVENLCYVVGANLCDREHEAKPTWGGSAIIDPWGEVLAELDDEEGFVLAPVDLARVAKLRQDMPVLNHQRFQTSLKDDV
ncbi:MAG TPA: hypothetical protein DCZ13_09085 [Porticoccaceae bacterium]|nr:hypothetical protein [Porticoccaceae bacterium]